MSPSILFISIFLFLLSACSHLSTAPRWEEFKNPTKNSAKAIGSYINGCLDGAKVLSPESDNYIVMRPQRNRFYGHPNLIQFIEELAEKAKQQNLGNLIVGDMAQPRGGPIKGGHESHQVGLDADLWFYTLTDKQKNQLTIQDLEEKPAPSFVHLKEEKPNFKYWTKETIKLLEIATQLNNLDRIFVNPVLKKHLCKYHQQEGWITKIRPWYGHHYHFHIRLKCPKDDLECIPQSSLPDSNGCDASLDWWFSPEAKKVSNKDPNEVKLEKEMPPACQTIREASDKNEDEN